MNRMKNIFSRMLLIFFFLGLMAGCSDTDPLPENPEDGNETPKPDPDDNKDDNNNQDSEFDFIKPVDGHPCLMFSVDELPKLRERVKEPGWYKDMYSAMSSDAEQYMSNSYYSMNPFPIRKKGKYSMLTCGRALGNYIINLAFCGYVSGKEGYMHRAVEALISACELTEPSAIGTESGPEIEAAYAANERGEVVKWATHLQVGDGAYSIAMGYDLLYPFMSSAQRTLVKTELEGFAKWLISNTAGYGRDTASASGCNHNPVHFGPLGLIALLLPDHASAPEWLGKAQERVSAYYACAADLDGYILEGHSYQAYGLAGGYPFTHALKRLKGTDLTKTIYPFLTVPIDQNRRNAYPNLFKNSGNQCLWKLLPNGSIVSMNDSRQTAPGEAAIMGALLNDNGIQLRAWLESTGYYSKGKFESSSWQSTYMRPYLFLTDKPVQPVMLSADNAGLSRKFEGGRVFARTGWNSVLDAHMGFTSGYDMHHAHNHFDENHVTFAALGEEFLFDAEYEANLTEHHTLVQVKDGDKIVEINEKKKIGKITHFSDKDGIVSVTGDATFAYDGLLSKAIRNVIFVRKSPCGPYLFFRDDMQLANGNKGNYTAQYITNPNNTMTQEGNNVVITGGNRNGKALIVAYTGDKSLRLTEHIYGPNETYTRPHKRPFKILDFFRKIESTVVNATNPAITTLMMPYTNKSDLPAYKVEQKGNDIIWTLTFKDGTKHTLVTNESGIQMK